MGQTLTRNGLNFGLLWLHLIPLWKRKDGKLLRAKLVRGKDISGFGKHTNKEGTHH